MRSIDIVEVEAGFSEIMEQVGVGEEIFIEKAGKPFARIIPVFQPELPPRVLGLGRGKLAIPDDFNAMEVETVQTMFENGI